MTHQKTATISARVSPRVNGMAHAVARLRGVTVSSFAATAIEEAARRGLLLETEQAGSTEGETDA